MLELNVHLEIFHLNCDKQTFDEFYRPDLGTCTKKESEDTTLKST